MLKVFNRQPESLSFNAKGRTILERFIPYKEIKSDAQAYIWIITVRHMRQFLDREQTCGWNNY
jgi:hypothetical protein